MDRKLVVIATWLALVHAAAAGPAAALSRDRWTNPQPYGVFFNDYQPNFYAGFVPREQQRDRIKIHLGRGNQLRLRIVLSEEAIDGYLPSQVARHDLYKELIDRQIIQLTTNTAWEAYAKRFAAERIAEVAARKGTVPPAEWRELNLRTLVKLVPERVYHVQKDFGRMLDEFAQRLKAADPPAPGGAGPRAGHDGGGGCDDPGGQRGDEVDRPPRDRRVVEPVHSPARRGSGYPDPDRGRGAPAGSPPTQARV